MAVGAGEGVLLADGAGGPPAAGVGAGPGLVGAGRARREVGPRGGVLADAGAARREDQLPPVDGEDAAHGVDGDDAVRAVAAVLADDAEGAGAEAGLAAAAPALAEEAQVVGAAEAGLALAALGDRGEGLQLEAGDAGRERVGGDEGVEGGGLGVALVAEQEGVLAAERGVARALARGRGDAGGGEGGAELVRGGLARGRAALERGQAALGAVGAGEAVVELGGGRGEAGPGLEARVDVVLRGRRRRSAVKGLGATPAYCGSAAAAAAEPRIPR